MAATAASWPSVRCSGRGAFAEESVVFSPPRIWRRVSTLTTPRFASAVTAVEAPGMVAESSARRMAPAESASRTSRWRLALRAGSKPWAPGASETQRASAGVAFSATSSHGASGDSRVTRTFWPGARKRRTASARGQAYSCAIQRATAAECGPKAAGASACTTERRRAGATSAGSSLEVAIT